MPNWGFALLCMGSFVMFWYLPIPIGRLNSWLEASSKGKRRTRIGLWPCRQLVQLLCRFMDWCEYPAKGWTALAFLVGFVVSVQVATNYQQGVIYWLCTDSTRKTIAVQELTLAFQHLGWFVAVVYWLAILCMVIAAISLVRGIRKGKINTDESNAIVNKLDEMKKEMHSDFADIKATLSIKSKGDEHD